MPRPLGIDPRLGEWLDEIEGRVGSLEKPGSPTPLYACALAALPSAATFINCFAYVTDTKITVVSDGTVWRRQDTGAAI